MKRKDLLLLTLLLSQTAPGYAMWNEADENIMREAGNAQRRGRLEVRRGFQVNLHPGVLDLEPDNNHLFNLGMAQVRNDDNRIEAPIQGHWLFQENRDNAENIATLQLSASFNNRWRVVGDIIKPIDHILLNTGPETPALLYFDGNNNVSKESTREQTWRNPRTNINYTRKIVKRDAVPSHTSKGSQVIYAEPFAVRDNPSKPKETYKGFYQSGNLNEHEKLPGKKKGNLLYSDGQYIYLPHVSQELWHKVNAEGEEAHAGFFIASYKDNQKLNFIDKATIPNGCLPEGLYQLLSVQDGGNRLTEKWQRLGETPSVVEIMTPAGLSSIPGFGSHAPHIVSNDEAILKTLRLQQAIQEIVAKTEEARALYPNVAEFVVVLGKTGSGKSALINGLAGGLNAQEDEDGNLRLHADQLLPGFNIGHHAVVGTKIPGVWFDEVNNKLYWDCPGFGDVRGPEEDIINAFAIDKIFQNSAVKVLLVAQDYDLDIRNTRGQGFYKLLNEITKLFPNREQLEDVLSLVVSQGGRPQPHVRLNSLQREVLAAGAELDLSRESRQLLHFLHTHNNRVFSFPQPQQEGAYHFDKGRIVNCITDIHQPFIMPVVNFKAGVSDKAKRKAGKYGQALNQYLTDYIKTEASQRVINRCMKLIDHNKDPIRNLREYLASIQNYLEALRQIPDYSPQTFIAVLKNLIDVNDIESIIETISFLKTIEETVVYNVANWSNAFLETIEKTRRLIALPKVKYVNDILSIKGPLVGTSDVVSALDGKTPSQINVFSLNTIFFDQNITKNGTCISIIAPKGKVVGGNAKIDISGLPGAKGADGAQPGADGQPGDPGHPGGDFFMNIPEGDFTNLTVDNNGGKGGAGGNGRNGENGPDGNLNHISRVESVLFIGGKANIETYTGTRYYYEDKGRDGTPGGNGGKPGKGGIGGSLTVIDHTVKHNSKNDNIGDDGKAGDAGNAGKGGLHGKDCVGDICEKMIIISSIRRDNGRPSAQQLNLSFPIENFPIQKSLKAPQHLDSKEKASDGKKPNDGELNEKIGKDPTNHPRGEAGAPGEGVNDLNQQNLKEQLVDFEEFKKNALNVYGKYYVKSSINPYICPLMTVFPDLPKIKVKLQEHEVENKETKVLCTEKSKKTAGKKAAFEVRAKDWDKKPFKVIFKGASQEFRIIDVPGDGDCGYHALGIEREEAANLLLQNLKKDPIIREFISHEIEDNFILLDHLLGTVGEYKVLMNQQTTIDERKAQIVRRLNEILRAEGIGIDALNVNQLLGYATVGLPEEFGVRKIALQDIVNEEDNLNQRKTQYCSQELVMQIYIDEYIRRAAKNYVKTFPGKEENWLQFSPDGENGNRGSVVKALACILGKNLVIWDTRGELKCRYTCENPEADTIHLLHNGGHYDRLELL